MGYRRLLFPGGRPPERGLGGHQSAPGLLSVLKRLVSMGIIRNGLPSSTSVTSELWEHVQNLFSVDGKRTLSLEFQGGPGEIRSTLGSKNFR